MSFRLIDCLSTGLTHINDQLIDFNCYFSLTSHTHFYILLIIGNKICVFLISLLLQSVFYLSFILLPATETPAIHY